MAMTNAELVNFLKSSAMFSSLDETVLEKMLKKFEKVHIAKKKILFKQGTASDSFYILVQGRLTLTIKTGKNGHKFSHEVLPGETIGELGALSYEPRTSTVKAIDDSLLLK